MTYFVFLAVLALVIVPEVLTRSMPMPHACLPCQSGTCSGCEDFNGSCKHSGCSYKNECKLYGEEWTDNCNRMTCIGNWDQVVEAKCMNPDGSCVGHNEEMYDPLCLCIVMEDRADVACPQRRK